MNRQDRQNEQSHSYQQSVAKWQDGCSSWSAKETTALLSSSKIKAVRQSRQPFLYNGSIDKTQLIAAAVQALRPYRSVWRGHWELSGLIQMLIGPKADWSRAFILLSTSHTLYLTGMSRIQFSIPSVPYLGTEYECATWLCFTAAHSAYRWHTHARHKEMVLMPNVSIKGPKDRERCLQNRPSPVCIVFENLKSFNVSHCVTSMTACGRRSLPDQEWAHSSPGQRHGRVLSKSMQWTCGWTW